VVRVRFGVVFRGFFGVMLGLHMMPMRQVGVMAGPLVFARFVMLGSVGVVLGGLLVMMRGLAVMVCGFFRHGVLSFVENQELRNGLSITAKNDSAMTAG
jgi:hypothetical protein